MIQQKEEKGRNMKTVSLFMFLSLMSLQAFAQIDFEGPTDPNPIVITITKGDDCAWHQDGDVCYFYDISHVRRIVLQKYNKGDYAYSIENSNGGIIQPGAWIDRLEGQRLNRILNSATAQCPVDVVVDRRSLMIADVTPSCS